MNFDIILACTWIFFGELYGNFVGGGSLVTQIFLQNIIGFEIKNAIALDNAAVLGSEIGLLLMLLRKEKIEKWMWYMMAVAGFWALFGANLLYIMPTQYVKLIFTFAVVWLVVKNLFFPSLGMKEKWFHADTKTLLFLFNYFSHCSYRSRTRTRVAGHLSPTKIFFLTKSRLRDSEQDRQDCQRQRNWNQRVPMVTHLDLLLYRFKHLI